MAEDDTFEIPTVDIAPYLADRGSEAAAQVVADVQKACMTTGFFSLVGHGVSAELQQRVLTAAAKLFALPLEEKKALRPSGLLKNRGYELIGSQVLEAGTLPDMKEGFFFGQNIPSSDARVQQHPFLMGENIFPAGIPDAELREPVEMYYQAVLQLAQTVLEILARGLPYGDDVFAAFTANDAYCSLRLLRYPPQPSTTAATNDNNNNNNGRQLGAGAHTDFGAVTLLYQDAMGGLEVLDAARGSWVPVAPNAAAYVVNIGDMLSLWTKNAYKSNVHRVINTSRADRYSVPFFFDGNLDVALAPLDGSAPAGGQVRTVEEHMLERLGATYGRARAQDVQAGRRVS